jgi:thymidylate synthase (FAD)|tara:strand:+ start:505 stop:1233 length:729 start_codon:yes stop_codon:yes gene_type:complete
MKVSLVDHMGSDLSIVNAARVSFDTHHDSVKEGDHKLIKYLADHNHWSPFAHTSLQFRIKAPIFVARQLAKHQVGLVWNEISRRYVDSEPEVYYPEKWRGKPVNKKQGSSNVEIDINPKSPSGPAMVDEYHHAVKKCQWTYTHLIRMGVAPEMARMVLPQSSYTEWYWTGSLYAFHRVCSLRLAEDAQHETREIAKEINKLCAINFPISWDCLDNVKEYPSTGFTDCFGVLPRIDPNPEGRN